MKQDRQEAFAKLFVQHRNGTKAALAVGISEKTARNWASQSLKKPKVKLMIAEFDKKLECRVGIDREKVLRQYMKIAFCEVDDIWNADGTLKDLDKLTENGKAAIAGIETEELIENGMKIGIVRKVKVRDSKAALDSISKMMGYNEPEKVDFTTKGESIVEGNLDKLSKQERILYFGLRKKMHGAGG